MLPLLMLNMFMSNHCVHLNLNINPVIIDHSKLKNAYQTAISTRDLNPELTSILNKCNIKVKYAESFYSSPGFIQKIHTDNLGGDYIKLNYVFDGKGSQMHWYKVKEGIPSGPISFTPDEGTVFLPWDSNMVDLVESDALSYPSLVQVGCPHNVTNPNEYRLCIALVLLDANHLQRISLNSAKNKLAEYVV
jgi:hypothetical protein